jgi:hypothetical protein
MSALKIDLKHPTRKMTSFLRKESYVNKKVICGLLKMKKKRYSVLYATILAQFFVLLKLSKKGFKLPEN